METKEIISSGILELYAAGLTSEKESQEVESWLIQYPEVAKELAAITAGVEAYAHAGAVRPDPSVKEKIFVRIAEENKGKEVLPYAAGNKHKGKVVGVSFWKMAAAASVALLIGSIILNLVTYNKYTRVDKDLVAARQTVSSLQEQNQVMEAGLSVVQNKYSVPVALNGLEAAPEAAAKVFWMKNTGEVFIDPSNLPDAPSGKQYQLWAIVDGKPLNGGMILTSQQGDKYRIQKMKSFGKADAFAVTLEPEKGNPTPQGPMFVMGEM